MTPQKIFRLGFSLTDKKPSAVHKECKVSRATASQWINGEIKSFNSENIFYVADFFGFSARWIGTGKGNMQPTRDELCADLTSEAINTAREYIELPKADQLKVDELIQLLALKNSVNQS